MEYIYLIMQENLVQEDAPVMAFGNEDDAEHFCDTAPFEVYIRQIPYVEKIKGE